MTRCSRRSRPATCRPCRCARTTLQPGALATHTKTQRLPSSCHGRAQVLRAEILQLEADFEKEEKVLAALLTEEKAEKAIEDKQLAKVSAEKAEEAAKEGTAIAEEADSSSAM